MSKDTGGQAYPSIDKRLSEDQTRIENVPIEGMTLLDRAAISAMQALIINETMARHFTLSSERPTQKIAECSYDMAKKMIAEKRRREAE